MSARPPASSSGVWDGAGRPLTEAEVQDRLDYFAEKRPDEATQAAFADAAGLTFHTKGMPPLDTPILAAAIEAKLRDEREDRALAAQTRLRCSDANGCARQIAFRSLGVPKSVEYSVESLIAFKAGDAYHRIAEEAAIRAVNARCELPVDWSPALSLSGHADSVYALRELKSLLPDDHPVVTRLRERGAKGGDLVAVEYKSMAGYGFKLAVGQVPGRKTELPGPKLADLLQCGMYALAPQVGARWVHMVYISKDINTTAEWLIGVDEPLTHLEGGPTLRQLVEAEHARLATLLATLDEGTLPARDVPGFGIVTDPPPHGAKGAQPWNCAYCSWNPTCAEMPAEAIPGWVPVFLATKEAAA